MRTSKRDLEQAVRVLNNTAGTEAGSDEFELYSSGTGHSLKQRRDGRGLWTISPECMKAGDLLNWISAYDAGIEFQKKKHREITTDRFLLVSDNCHAMYSRMRQIIRGEIDSNHYDTLRDLLDVIFDDCRLKIDLDGPATLREFRQLIAGQMISDELGDLDLRQIIQHYRDRIAESDPLPPAPKCTAPGCEYFAGETAGKDQELRVLPIGESNAILCRGCFDHEIQYRKVRNQDLEENARFDLPAWEDLRFVGESR